MKLCCETKNQLVVSSEDFPDLNVYVKVFVFVSLCPYYCYIWGTCKDRQRKEKIYQVVCLGGTIAVEVIKRNNARKIFQECDILDIDTEDALKRLNLILFCKSRLVLSSVFKSMVFIEYFATLTPFLITTFLAFYNPTSLSCGLCIKNKDGHQTRINCS